MTVRQPEQAGLEKARALALKRLALKPHSVWELKQELLRRQVSEAVADQLIERFIETRLLDDADYAQRWVATRRGSRHASSARLRRELEDKGIASSIIDAALETIEDSDLDLAVDFLRRRARSLVGLDSTTVTRRLAAQLQRRAFSTSVVRQAVNQVVAELDAAQELGEQP